jgi:hypothetical protein
MSDCEALPVCSQPRGLAPKLGYSSSVDDGLGTASALSGDDGAPNPLVDAETVGAQAVDASVAAPIARKVNVARIQFPFN